MYIVINVKIKINLESLKEQALIYNNNSVYFQ